MKGDFVQLGAGELSQSEPHDEFLELCAVSASGELTPEEQHKLNQHLNVCPSCREVLHQYESIVGGAFPAIAAEGDHTSLPSPGWSQKKAEERFQLGLAENRGAGANSTIEVHPSDFVPRRLPPSSDTAWNQMWMLYASGLVLFVGLGVFAYRVGIHRGSASAKHIPVSTVHSNTPDQSIIEAQLSDAGHERALARTRIRERDREIAALKRQMAQQAAEITGLRSAQEQLQADLSTETLKNTDLAKRKAELTQKLDAAEGGARLLQTKLDLFTQQSAQDAVRAKSADAKVEELTRLLGDRENEIEQQEQMLAHDRDIRELMAARDLYIAEVYDVSEKGETRKPYGRVFYTRGKSLIFYAYDLDQQAQLKRTSTFQAWGRRGPDRERALNLGIFYQDNSSNKRWVMKCDDTRSLAQIDGVFVTIEANGPSHKPSDRTLLFASLKVNPNHP